jgi:hypothetical protein
MDEDLMSLEEINNFLPENDGETYWNFCDKQYFRCRTSTAIALQKTARAAHEWKARYDELNSLIERDRAEYDSSEVLRAELAKTNDFLKQVGDTCAEAEKENKRLRAQNQFWEEKYDHENPQGLVQYALSAEHHDEHHAQEERLKAENGRLKQAIAISCDEQRHEYSACERAITAENENEKLREQLRVARAEDTVRLKSALKGVITMWDRLYPTMPVNEIYEDAEFGEMLRARSALGDTE